MKSLVAVFVLVAAFAGATTTTYQQGVSGPTGSANNDNYMDNNAATTNNASATTIRAGKASTGTTVLRGLFMFVLSDIPEGAVISSATLTLKVTAISGSPSSGTFKRIRREDWSVTTSSWTNYKTASAWSTSGAGGTTNDYDNAMTAGTHAAPPAVGNTFNVTGLATIAQDAIDNRFKKMHLRWILDSESNSVSVQVASAEDATSSNRPSLSVTWTYYIPVPRQLMMMKLILPDRWYWNYQSKEWVS